MATRRISTVAHVGQIGIGGDNPIRVQSMTTTNTNDTEACVSQAKRIIAAGGELVRLTTQGTREAENMRNISARLKSEGIMTPLVADVHFNARVAEVAARYCEKVRINPGNYVDPARTFRRLEYSDAEYQAELQKIDDRLVPFINICKQNKTAVRIGVNHGSLSDRIMSRYGDTPEGIVESSMEFLRIFRREHFDDVVISIKASNTVVMVQSVRLLVRAMDSEDMHYPLHLGVTEAGEGEDGRIKSAVGIGALLTEGIGDTIRVSLSEEPECEIPVARRLVELIPECTRLRQEAEAGIKDGTIRLHVEADTWEDLQLKAAMAVGALLIDRKATDIKITAPHYDSLQLEVLEAALLQAARIKFTKTEYISCPGCGRTLYNLQDTIRRIKAATQHLVGLKIGIMGCIVNGPGEMADADYGYVGAGPGRISLYKEKECVEKNIPEDEAVDRLLKLIEHDHPTLNIQHPAPKNSARLLLLLLLALMPSMWAIAQGSKAGKNPEDRRVNMDAPTFQPTVKVGRVLDDGDSIQYVEMNNIYVYAPATFKNEKQRQQYTRLVYNVKKVLPIAKECRQIIRETYEVLQLMPDKKARDEHLKLVEEEIKRTYTPRMKKLTYSQGKLLIKLVDRECNSTSYGLIQAILGPVKAGFYQAFAWIYGASLKKHYDPEGVDRLTERVVRMVESGQL